MKKTLVIIPTYNEKDNIAPMIRKIMSLSLPFHLLIIDDNSPDGTAAIVKELQKEFPDRLFLEERSGKLGLGTAYIHGFKYALRQGYEYVCEMDADFSHNPEDLVRLYNTCEEEGYDLAIGSRYVNGITVINWPISRVLMSFFASKYVQFITGMPFHDATAGFKCYRRSLLETINFESIKFVGYAFQIQMKFLAWKHGFKIKEVPIIFTDRTLGQSKMSKHIFKEAVIGVIRMKISSLFAKYHPAD
ncbi:MAG TPA: polyprenol monophosphomannose synthase [Cytophagaceae bacterium]